MGSGTRHCYEWEYCLQIRLGVIWHVCIICVFSLSSFPFFMHRTDSNGLGFIWMVLNHNHTEFSIVSKYVYMCELLSMRCRNRNRSVFLRKGWKNGVLNSFSRIGSKLNCQYHSNATRIIKIGKSIRMLWFEKKNASTNRWYFYT